MGAQFHTFSVNDIKFSNPRLGCFGEIDSHGYGTHFNGTDPPPPPPPLPRVMGDYAGVI